MSSSTIIQGEQNCTSAVEKTTLKKVFTWQSGDSKKKKREWTWKANYSFLNFKFARWAQHTCILDMYSCTKNLFLITQETTEISCLLKEARYIYKDQDQLCRSCTSEVASFWERIISQRFLKSQITFWNRTALKGIYFIKTIASL